jgi:hypothetical protein
VPLPAVWAQLGYSPEEIAEFQRMAQQQDAQKMAAIATALRTQQAQGGQQAAQGQQNGGNNGAANLLQAGA